MDSEAATPSAGSGGTGTPMTGGAGGADAGSGGTLIIPGGGCPSCPDATYGLVIHGDGADIAMALNAPDERDCPTDPLRGTTAGCGGSLIYLSACEEAQGGGACLELWGRKATYTQRDTGTVWTGDITGLMRNADPLPYGTESGTVTLELTSGAASLVLTVDYALCRDGDFVRVVC